MVQIYTFIFNLQLLKEKKEKPTQKNIKNLYSAFNQVFA